MGSGSGFPCVWRVLCVVPSGDLLASLPASLSSSYHPRLYLCCFLPSTLSVTLMGEKEWQAGRRLSDSGEAW